MTDKESGANEALPLRLALTIDHSSCVNFASAQNDIPILRELTLSNLSDQPLIDARVQVTATPPVVEPKSWVIDHIDANAAFSVRDLHIPLSSEALSALNETVRGTLSFEVTQGEEVLHTDVRHLDLLSKDHWGGLAEMDRLLAAFVAPNDPVVAGLLKEASALLQAAGHDGAIEGYQSGNPARVWMIAGAIWSAATALGLTYANPPASFEVHGQKVRSPARIKHEGLATCLDSALLLAAAWEQAGLHPSILFAQGHAFCGVWLMPKDFGAVTEPDVVTVRKAVQAQEFVAIESTMLTHRPAAGFEAAAEAGRERLSEVREHEFVQAVDICRARAARIRPLSSDMDVSEPDAPAGDVSPAELPEPIVFDFLSDDMPAPNSPKGRIERWQAKLLDLSLRNRLLNFKPTRQTVPCMVPDAGRLEDALADRKSFKAYPMLEEDPIGERQVATKEREEIISATVRDAYEKGQITIPLNKAETQKRLLGLYRKAKSDLQEGGTNTLYLAAGFLRWQREGENRTYRAPLLLIPIKLERRSARSEFRIVHHEDDVQFNATLLEFLKRDFDLDLPELAGDLPTDDSGIDLPRIIATLRHKVRDVRGFEVVEDLAISTFSFSKYLMWKDLVERTDELRNNRLVTHLVDNPEQIFDAGGGDGNVIAPHQLDQRFAPEELVTPLPADSSQLAAVVAATQERDFVLIGPPGTGKSQTIANIICQCLAHGKTVLFVAEKAAALNVVQRRLQAHGLGDAVLELHSNKTDRKSVLEQLGRGWDRAAGCQEDDWLEINRDLKLKRDQLNTYVADLHGDGGQGFSIYEALGWIATRPKGFALDFAHKDAHDADAFEELVDLAEMLARTHRATEHLTQMPLVVAKDWSFAWENDFLKATSDLRRTTDQMLVAGRSLMSRLGLSAQVELTPLVAEDLDTLAARADDGADDLRQVPDGDRGDLILLLSELRERIGQMNAAEDEMAATYADEDVLHMPLDDLDQNWREAQAALWPLSFLKSRKITKILQSYASDGEVDPDTDLPALRRLRKGLIALADDPMTALAGNEVSVSHAQGFCDQASDLREVLARFAVSVADTVAFGSAQAGLAAGPDGALAEALQGWGSARSAYKAQVTKFQHLQGHVPEDVFGPNLIRELDVILTNKTRLADWTRWCEARAKADAAGMGDFADRIEAGEIKGPAGEAFRQAYARWWVPLALDASEPLRRFLHWEHEDRVRAFCDLDDKAAAIAPAEAMRRAYHDLPGRDEVARKSELGTLRHQLGLKRPSMAIRPLLGALKETLPRLAPCVLMSPLSIAQYLPAGQAVFDLVIFDEASQITTWDAVGAIARARQSIVVGDPKQLPPTNFFGRADEGEEDGDPLLEDMPSILDEVATAGVPVRRLDWHYRSRDEALIAFSNHHYYEDRLVTFPAPATGSDAVQFHKIDGTYLRGAGRTNPDEAAAIVALIARRLSVWLQLAEHERPTLGVITFNAQQQGLILDLLDELRRARGDLEWFFSEDREEPLIVKNLENIQGDERDVMLFSITFGPDKGGKLSMAFGALNVDGGEKRLNVAVTRARQELHVFSSITADQIDLSRTRATGVSHLKTFLDYAERGPIALPQGEDGENSRDATGFEAAVADAFRAKGWDVHAQVGVSGFRINLAVVNPDREGAYLAGIECDGTTYQNSATARDRDKVRQAVLEGLGWNILRVWSTEWFRDPASVISRVHERLEALLAEDRARPGDEPPEPEAGIEEVLLKLSVSETAALT